MNSTDLKLSGKFFFPVTLFAIVSKIPGHGSPARAYIAYHRLGPPRAPRPARMEPPAHAAHTPTACECPHPSVFYLLATLLLTSCSTALLCAAMMTQHWERVSWSRPAAGALANASRVSLQWLLDGKVAKIEDTSKKKHRMSTFLVPMHGGIWSMCLSLDDEEVSMLATVGFPTQPRCTHYLADGGAEHAEPRADWQHRMQNLSISCALVCLIVLGAAALLGAFGLCQHQISAVLVTGVMYLLAGLFALFALMIIHFKRVQRGSDSADGVWGGGGGVGGAVGGAAQALLGARRISTAWSLQLGWAGVGAAALAAALWILLSKIMRYNPISTMLL